MSVRIGLITTLDTNIGDDFIRVGLCRVLERIFADRKVEFVAVNKHRPYTAYGPLHPVQIARLANYLPLGKRRVGDAVQSLLGTPSLSRFENCAAVVQCGAPVLWPQCSRCEWAEPLWHQIVGRIHERIPVLNLAAGSSYPWENQPTNVTDDGDARFLRAIHSYCRLTTVRDPLSRALFEGLGCEVQHIACSALLAAGESSAPLNKDGVVLINYMSGGGHYDFGQSVDANHWRDTMRTTVERLSTRHRVAFICHNQAEADAAANLAPEILRYWPRTVEEYFSIAAGAKAGIFNRMHASVALAGMGIPSIAIGTDTRLLMVQHLGLPCHFVKEAPADVLEAELEHLLSTASEEQERLRNLRRETFDEYSQRVSAALHTLAPGTH